MSNKKPGTSMVSKRYKKLTVNDNLLKPSTAVGPSAQSLESGSLISDIHMFQRKEHSQDSACNMQSSTLK